MTVARLITAITGFLMLL